ncbi:MAG: class I SAM-dependent methyltransferase [Methylobacter sp.]|jgi:predicted O-methyltransferase YrrM|nr:class I SAM-dependent methyltransferase [Methylobacter sp.]
MSLQSLKEALLSGRPYFGTAMRALQGVPIRHAYMQAVVELLSKENHTEPFKVLEVGSWAGGSAITWAKAIQEYIGGGQVVCVDVWQSYFDTNIDSDLVYIQMNEAAQSGSIYGLFLHNIRTSGVAGLISPMIGNSHDVLPTLEKGNFSIVFLDGSHRFDDVKNDIALSLDIIKEGGILCGDDLELQISEVGSAEAAEDVATDQDYVKSKLCGIDYHPGVTCAVGETFGEVSMWDGFWAMRKTATGWIKVDLSNCKIVIPEHIAAAEPFTSEPVNEPRAITAMIQIAKQITSLDLCEYDPNVAKLLGSYAGFNFVKHLDHFYKVRQSLGAIDWSLSYPTLKKQYAKTDFFRYSDINAILYDIGLDDLVSYVDKIAIDFDKIAIAFLLRQEQGTSAAVQEQLRYLQQQSNARNKLAVETGRPLNELLERFDAVQTIFASGRQAVHQALENLQQRTDAENKRTRRTIDILEAQLTKLAETAFAEQQANKMEIDAIRQEAIVAHERTISIVNALEAQLKQCQTQIEKQQQLINKLQRPE